MDIFESVCTQLGEFIAFDAVRIVDPDSNRVVQEKHAASFTGHFPDLTLSQTRKYLCLSTSTGKPVLNFIHEKNWLFLLMSSPFRISNKTMLSASLMDMPSHIFLNDIDLNDERGLLNEVKRLHLQAVTDELTGLFNRRYIDERLPSEILACMKKKRPLSVIFADLDFYKQVNDTYGHAAGDSILCELAGILTCNVRKEKDWVARYGGEEFIIFLNGIGYKKSRGIAERIRVAVMGHTFRHNGREIKITCSFGVVTIDDFSISPTVDEILDIADKRLYRAKELGRNTVV